MKFWFIANTSEVLALAWDTGRVRTNRDFLGNTDAGSDPVFLFTELLNRGIS